MSKKAQINESRSLSVNSFCPATQNQKLAHQLFRTGKNLLLHGSAGTGKSFLALALGLKEVLSKKHESLTIIRSIVPVRDVGHLPGTLEEKISQYELPYKALVCELVGQKNAYDNLKQKGVIQFLSTTHLRGITIRNSFIFVDEIQNMNYHEAESTITRTGENCRLIIAGDTNQTDLKNGEREGVHRFMKVIERMPSFAMVQFGKDDIVRSGIVKEFLIAKSELNF